jgi:putative FmdB family regulatory protein
MPTYEYQCEACGQKFEKFQSITSAPIKKCILCGQNKARRLISAGAGLIFKGSGFYITDYRSDSYKSAAKSESPSTTSSSSSDSAKSSSADKPAETSSSSSSSTTTPSSSPSKPSTPAKSK